MFLPRALPEVRALAPPARHPQGYDGQFYAQLALAPTLERPELATALDSPAYRARRIALPALAHWIGLGRPTWILQVYAVLNLAFWAALLAVLGRWVGFAGLRERLLAASLLWTAGSWISIERALTDLPALSVSLCGLMLAERRAPAAAGMLAASALFKETSALSFPSLAWIGAGHPVRRLVWVVPLLVLPTLLWHAYVRSMLPSPAEGLISFGFPLLGMARKIWTELTRGALVELVSAGALVVQTAYLLTRPRLQCTVWRWGLGFALLAVCFTEYVWVEQYAYTRVLLPLTAAFNLLLYRNEQGRAYGAWMLLGNLGLLGRPFAGPTRWLVVAWLALELWSWLRRRRAVSPGAVVSGGP